MHGRANDDTLVTLQNVRHAGGRASYRARGPAVETAIFRPGVTYLGDLLPETPQFAYARVEYAHFDKWIGGLSLVPVHHYGDSGMLDRYSVSAEWPDPVAVELPEGMLAFQGAYDVRQTGNDQVSMRTSGYVEWHLREPSDFDTALRSIASLQMLLALLMDYPVVAEHIILKSDARANVECRAYFQAVYETPEREPLREDEMFFDAPGLSVPLQELLPRWQSVRETFETPANILTALRYASPGLTDLQFIAMVQACEAFHAAGFPNLVVGEDEFRAKRDDVKQRLTRDQWEWIGNRISNEPSLKLRLVALMDDVSDVIAPVALDGVDRCATRIRDLRNGMTHPRDNREAGQNGVQYLYYARLMAFLLKVQLLKELGLLDPETVQRLGRSRQSSEIAHIATQVGEAGP